MTLTDSIKKVEYAAYKGEDIIGVGTIDELAKTTGFTKQTLKFSATPTARKRNKGNKLVLYKIEDE